MAETYVETGHVQVVKVVLLRHGIVVKKFKRGRVGRKSEFRARNPENVVDSNK